MQQVGTQVGLEVSADALAGTLGYLAPEQTGRMNRSVDRRSDRYSLGVTLYRLATGRGPGQVTQPVAAEVRLKPRARGMTPPVNVEREGCTP